MLLVQRHKELESLGAQVLGISVDHLPAMRVFDAAHSHFPFPLAADWHRGICRQYGVLDEESQAARRVLALCDESLTIRQVVWDFDPTKPEMMDPIFRALQH